MLLKVFRIKINFYNSRILEFFLKCKNLEYQIFELKIPKQFLLKLLKLKTYHR